MPYVISKATSQQAYTPSIRGEGIYTSADKEAIMSGENIGDERERELWSEEKGVTLDTLYKVIRRSPEVVGVIKAIVEDVMADGWDFIGSKSAIKKAKKSDEDMNFFKYHGDALWDLLITGDAFILKLNIDPKEIHRFVNSKFNNLTFKHLDKDNIQKIIVSDLVEKVPKETRALQVIRSGTMKGDFDEFGNVKKWIQKIPGKKAIPFDPEDIIHLSITNIGGSRYGFTPLQTLLSDIGTLIFAKETAGKIFENQGVPPNIWFLPDAVNADEDRNYQLLKKELKELKKHKNKLRDLIVTGKVERQDSGKSIISEMQFRELIIHFTNIILLAWGMPAHRIPFIQARTTQFPKESNDGYFKMIGFIQRTLEPQFNKLWREWKVKIHYNKAYRIDELREANIAVMMMDRGAITVNEARERLGMIREFPLNDRMPSNLKQGIFTRFEEEKDEKMQEGEMPLETDNTPEFEDNKTK